MKTLLIPKGKGKTIKLIEMAHVNTGMYIVCQSHKEVQRIMLLAQSMNIDINQPITYQEFDTRQYTSQNIKGFLFDNLDNYIQSKTKVNIAYCTITLE